VDFSLYTDRGLTTNFFNEYKRICRQNTSSSDIPKCNSGDAYITYAESQDISQFWWIFDVFNLNNTDGERILNSLYIPYYCILSAELTKNALL